MIKLGNQQIKMKTPSASERRNSKEIVAQFKKESTRKMLEDDTKKLSMRKKSKSKGKKTE